MRVLRLERSQLGAVERVVTRIAGGRGRGVKMGCGWEGGE